jgi:hypothetical protein
MAIFGNEKTFGIQCLITNDPPVNGWIFIRCHLFLGGQLIGNQDETDSLGVTSQHLEMLRDRVAGLPGTISHPLFQFLTDIEILELILKSNQLEEEFEPQYYYLPALEAEGLFGKHSFYVGESTNAYFLVVIEQLGLLKFLWKNFRRKENVTHSVYCSREEVVSAINACLKYLKNSFPTQMASVQV